MNYAIIGLGKIGTAIARAAQRRQGKIVIDATNAFGILPEELAGYPRPPSLQRRWWGRNW
ncbi:MAG: hypothetical protein ACREV7_00990 [Steroidobacteraceae bacterium]